jgi:hypothetical protein
MSGLLDRLARNARAYVYDFLEKHLPGASSPPLEDTDTSTWHRTTDDPFTASSPVEPPPAEAHTGLPYSPELAQCYRLLDLPFGTPLAQVTKQWKAYLRKCHPDLHAYDQAKQAEATELTQQLNDAYQKIRLAWTRYQPKTS